MDRLIFGIAFTDIRRRGNEEGLRGRWIALLNPRDQFHRRARSMAESFGPLVICTSEPVLSETLSFYSRRGPFLRAAAAEMVLALYSEPNAFVVPQSSAQFQSGLRLYRERTDKFWSRTDCVSFQIMNDEGMTEALTHDAHLEQAGFVALLRSRAT
jgi:predicted nucleic acid-binding protein